MHIDIRKDWVMDDLQILYQVSILDLLAKIYLSLLTRVTCNDRNFYESSGTLRVLVHGVPTQQNLGHCAVACHAYSNNVQVGECNLYWSRYPVWFGLSVYFFVSCLSEESMFRSKVLYFHPIHVVHMLRIISAPRLSDSRQRWGLKCLGV